VTNRIKRFRKIKSIDYDKWVGVEYSGDGVKQAVFRSCSACRTLQHGSSSKHRDGRMLSHYWNIYTGYRFTRGSPTSWPY